MGNPRGERLATTDRPELALSARGAARLEWVRVPGLRIENEFGNPCPRTFLLPSSPTAHVRTLHGGYVKLRHLHHCGEGAL